MNKTQLIIIIIIVVAVATGVFYSLLWEKLEDHEVIRTEPKNEVKHGEVKQYTSDGKLKTRVNYQKGVKEGTSDLFHDDGKTILLSMPYHNGKREGTSKKYYKSGKIYAETDYHDDQLHGFRKIYYTTGQLKSQVPYHQNFPGIGTVEFLKNGTKKDMPSILFTRNGNRLLLSLSKDCNKATFYLGQLIDDQYFNFLSEKIIKLPSANGGSYIDLNVYTPSYLQYQDIICECKSSQGNPVILTKKAQL